MAYNNTLTDLQLLHNDITDIGAKEIGKMLKINKSLKILNVYHNKIGDEGAMEIFRALKVNEVLDVLYIGDNGISESGMDMFGKLKKYRYNRSVKISFML